MSKQKAARQPDSEEFATFWRMYPRKEAKGAARKAFAKAITLASFEDIMAGLERQVPILLGKDPQYIAHPATWLNQERWEDELIPNNSTNPKHGSLANAAAAYNASFGYFDASPRLPTFGKH